ncbi:unnamed protein product [Effrenium voratum]|uniref:Uncharacterized protein n=1 Tax=Effrenium voratum TaxID=2562239 RepID=A0AA36IU08_9DINO|nr:unnamed protein product [Effrenium voratum]
MKRLQERGTFEVRPIHFPRLWKWARLLLRRARRAFIWLVRAPRATFEMAGYNRSNYFENLHLKQSRNFRRQQIVTSQADLFRADVEQAIGASCAVQDRLIVVSALLLGLSAHTYGFSINDQTRDFLQALFYLSVSNSFLYFLMALIASTSANILARKCQKELLNNCVRPPFADMMRDVDEAAEAESAEAFERQGVQQLLRVPVADQLLPEQQAECDLKAFASMDHLITQHISNELILMEMQQDWDELLTYTPYFLVWGLRSLLNGFGFFALAHTYENSKPYGFQVHIFYVIIVAGLGCISERLMATNTIVFASEMSFLILGQILCSYVAWRDRHGAVAHHNGLILIALFSQLLNSMVAHFRFVYNAQELKRAFSKPGQPDSPLRPSPLRRDRAMSSDSVASTEDWTLESLELAPEVLKMVSQEELLSHGRDFSHSQDVLSVRWRHLSKIRVHLRRFCIFGGWAVIVAWLVISGWQTWTLCFDDGRPPVQALRRAQAVQVDDLQLVTLMVEMPAAGCAGSATFLLAAPAGPAAGCPGHLRRRALCGPAAV